MCQHCRCNEYEAKIAALESVPTTETDAAHLLLSEPGLGEETVEKNTKRNSVCELQMQVSILEEQVRVKEQRLQDLEQNKVRLCDELIVTILKL